MTKIHKLFQPIVLNTPKTQYYEYFPSEVLQPYVSCYWISSSNKGYQGKVIKSPVIPDACCDILFDTDKKRNSVDVSFCGLFDKMFYASQNRDNSIETFGIRFHPAGIYPFFRIPLNHFTNRIVDIYSLHKNMLQLGIRLSNATSIQEKIIITDTYLKRLLPITNLSEQDLINNLLYSIFINKGLISVTDLAANEKISVRKLHRLFLKWIGLGPKRFCQIARFQYTLQYVHRHHSGDWSSVAYELGYFDQAHFIKDFKRYFGNVPSAINVSEFYNSKIKLPAIFDSN